MKVSAHWPAATVALHDTVPSLTVTVPVGVRDGLPQAVQIIGPRFREDLCLDAAETIETVLGIHDTPLYRQLQDG